MFVLMHESRHGYLDGCGLHYFSKHGLFDMPARLAVRLIRLGYASRIIVHAD